MQSRLALALFATTCALVAVIGVILISHVNGQPNGPDVVHAPDSKFRGGTLPPNVKAPNFTLTDQDGKRVSMAQFRGKPVVVTYLYTHCKETCPVAAQMIRGALDDLGRRQVPALAISVDPFNDTARSARRFLAKAGMGRRMLFLLGTRRQLLPVWHGFAVQPQLKEAEHQSLITLVDAKGMQRVAVGVNQTSPEDLAHDIGVLEDEQS